MPRLTTERYLQARAFLNDHARPLELALFEHDFEAAPAWPVFDALAAFQNDDGGFAHGLEPDSLSPSSGALATSVALRVLCEVGAPATHPMVTSAVAYLERTFEESTGTWRIVPADTESYPHAPWWSQDGLNERFNAFRLNPKAEIVAHLFSLGALDERDWLLAEARAVLREVEAATETGIEMHDLLGACRLLDAGGLPADLRQALRSVLAPAARQALSAAAGGGYGLRALSVAPRPNSALADELADQIVIELEGLLASQADDGAWWPSWDWAAAPGTEAASAWAKSQAAWAGVITLENLRSLHANGLVDRG